MNVPRITPREVQEKLAEREPVEFLDARNDKAWSSSDEKIPRAIRTRTDAEVEDVKKRLSKDETIVTYCT